MTSLTLANVAQALAARLEQALENQIVDPLHPEHGAIVRPGWRLTDPASAAVTLASGALLYLAGARGGLSNAAPGASWLERTHLAADALLRAQRPTGRIDLRSCNYDSSPDTGFAVERLCPVLELGRSVEPGDPAWRALLLKIEQFVRRAVPGMLEGGFHTPNHRWVIAAALAQAGALFPELPVAPTIRAYVAEGFDVDAEGAFIERSVGVYDAVCDRSLLLLADHWDDADTQRAARAAACANLDLDLYLLHADGTAETGLSRRQDYGRRFVPLGLAAPYLYAAHVAHRADFFRAAQALWASAADPGLDELNWLCYVLQKYGEPAAPPARLPDDYARLFPLNGIWRVRQGALSATLFRDATRLLTVVYGRAELTGLKINQSYFNVGPFVGDALEARGDEVILHCEGRSRLHRPGYDLPLGRPVSPERWQETVLERETLAFPPCASTLTVRRAAGGLDLCYRTPDNLAGVAAQVALDFAPGGVWETADTCLRPAAGQVLFLKQGYGSMRYGNDVIRVGRGAHAHRTWDMRHAEPAPDRVRVLLTFFTPVDHAFSLHTHHGPDAPR